MIVGSHRLTDHRDEKIWRWDSEGHFTVKSYYTFLINRGIVFAHKHMWNIKAPLKVKILMWVMLKGRLNTLDLIAHRGIGQGGLCVLCGIALESLNHLVLECDCTMAIWNKFLNDFDVHNFPTDVVDLWSGWRLLGSGSNK